MVWELGKKGSGRRITLSSPQRDSADFLRTKQSGERALGEGRQGPSPQCPTLMMGEGWREPAFYFCSPGAQPHLAFSPLQGWSRRTAPPRGLGSYVATVHICANQEARAPPPGGHSPWPGRQGLIHSLTHHPLQPHCRKTWQRSPPGTLGHSQLWHLR